MSLHLTVKTIVPKKLEFLQDSHAGRRLKLGFGRREELVSWKETSQGPKNLSDSPAGELEAQRIEWAGLLPHLDCLLLNNTRK